ncbi:alpha/beta hydrolase [Geomesophilobacter sediminis]|uniref:Alpha/beta hydrolase n=1 Tax=Geomesophilobacter sediminis TaxID=2798584 RepID=A0A8J7JFQ3_9BACT|nr:alpha/beta hydrolase [Geomesophilobacter sediminis]MBJ6725214.1 alpha/beta hydrolase [Geomesophilobacter sediminis]
MYLRVLIISWLLLLPLAALSAETEYGYPIPGAYEATILGTPASLVPELPTKMRFRQLVLEVLPDRKKSDVFFYDDGLRCSFAYQKQKAPLVFLIAGTGTNDRAAKLMFMVKALYAVGFHVIALPSPSHANFIVSASRSGVPGDLTEDSADLYRAMETAWKKVAGDIEVSSFYLGGYSMGATQSAFVAKLDEQRRVFNFKKVLMINPAVSLYNSGGKLEELLKQIPGGPKKEGIFFNKMLTKFSEYYSYGNFVAINDDFLYSIYTEKLFSPEETAGLIGLTFRINLAGMIFASDVVTNSGYVVPKNRVLKSSDSLSDYFMVATHLSFYDYINEYFYPYFKKQRPGLTKDALIEAQSLRSIEGYLKSSPKFGVMTNENDFILSKADLDYLKRIFAGRIKIYPRGGHIGNLEYKDNLAYMVAFFQEKEMLR